MTKLIILEGLDRVGKDTQNRNIEDLLMNIGYNVINRHFSSPNDGLQETQYYTFVKRFYEVLKSNDDEIFIWNRSHIGEYVYGPLYRNKSGDFIFEIENRFPSVIQNTILFTFIDEPDNILDRDDGESLSKNKRGNIIKEIDAFKLAHKKTNIMKKQLINIDGYDEHVVFEMIKDILMEVIDVY